MSINSDDYITEYIKDWIDHQNKTKDESEQMRYSSIHLRVYRGDGVLVKYYYYKGSCLQRGKYGTLEKSEKFISKKDIKYQKLKMLLNE